MARDGGSIWALLEEAAETLPEPFGRSDLIAWVSQRRPDVETSSISTHIHYALVETTNRSGPWSSRVPFLERVDRGVYRRRRGVVEIAPSAPLDVPAGTSAGRRAASAPAGRSQHVLLVGCSRTKAGAPMPGADLFQGVGFRRARDFARRSGSPWFILSAKFGLVHPDDVLGPYDVYLAKQPASYQSAWGSWVVAQLSNRLHLSGVTVEIHASDAYCAPLREPLRLAGAAVLEPLAGLGQGQRLAWPGYRVAPPPAADDVGVIDALLDPAAAVTPGELLLAGRNDLDAPGLYTWWVDDGGAAQLSRGMGHPIAAGLLYAGKAGGHRAEASPSTSTLWGRVVGNHLRGNVRSSTFRQSLAALLSAAALPASEDAVSAWMLAHLKIATRPAPSEAVARLEEELVARACPPLNLSGVPRDEARSALTQLRGLFRRPQAGPDDVAGEALGAGSSDEAVRAFEGRIRSDLADIVAAGYRPTVFQRMLAEHGVLETAKRLLASSQLSDGFRYLWEHGLLRFSIENAVLDPAFLALFDDRERDIARRRLRDAGFH